ncbi:MAG: hypothetical protein ACLTQE_02295 [Proteus mirabilis]
MFDSWFEEQDEDIQIEVLAVLMILREDGPNLGRPQVDTLKGKISEYEGTENSGWWSSD